MMNRLPLPFLFLLILPSLTFAWGTGHDAVAQLLEEFMPVEVKSFFEADGGRDGGSALPDLQKFCHYPDLPNKTLEQTGEIVGPEDEQILNDFGYSSSDWLHRHPGRAACYVLLTKAFREGNRKNAAFYLAVLSHSMSDQGAVNHTPILQFTSYSHLAGVDYGIRNSCELGLKNENVSRQIHERLSRFQPELLAESFPESVYAVVMDCYRQAEVSAEIEVKIAFGDRETSECVMARIAVEQLESILNMTFSAWHFARAQKEPVFTPEALEDMKTKSKAERAERDTAKTELAGMKADTDLMSPQEKALYELDQKYQSKVAALDKKIAATEKAGGDASALYGQYSQIEQWRQDEIAKIGQGVIDERQKQSDSEYAAWKERNPELEKPERKDARLVAAEAKVQEARDSQAEAILTGVGLEEADMELKSAEEGLAKTIAEVSGEARGKAKDEWQKAQKAYDDAKANGADNKTLNDLLQAVKEAKSKYDTENEAYFAAVGSLRQQTEADITDAVDTTLSSSGTFSAYGMDAAVESDIPAQTLDVLRKLLNNTDEIVEEQKNDGTFTK